MSSRRRPDPTWKPEPGTGLDLTHPRTSKLVAYWAFNEGAGQVVRDLAGRNDTIASASLVWSPAWDGMRADIPDNYSFATPTIVHGVGTGDFTWTCRVKMRSLGGPYADAIATLGIYTPCLYPRLSGNLWGIYLGADVSSGSTLSLNRDYHLAVVRRSGTVSYYEDGRLVGSAAAAGSIADAVMTFSAEQPGSLISYLDGQLGPFGFWARAITPAEVIDDFAAPYAIFLPPPARPLKAPAAGGVAAKLPWHLFFAAH